MNAADFPKEKERKEIEQSLEETMKKLVGYIYFKNLFILFLAALDSTMHGFL